MNKKFFMLAVSGALAAASAAHADTANVEVYGKLYPELTVQEATGATRPGAPGVSTLVDPGDLVAVDPKSTTFIQSSNSYIGFEGDIEVGGGLTGWFQVEQAIAIDGGESGEAFWSTRNSAVGLEGGFGTVFLGTWDTAYKQVGGAVSFLGLTSGNFPSSSNILSRFGFGDSRDGRFHERPENYIEYDSPEIGGFQFLVGYSPDEDRAGDFTGGIDAPANANQSLISAAGKWESGPLYLALGYEIHNDFFALTDAGGVNPNLTTPSTATASEDTAIRVSVGYDLGATEIGFDYSTLQWEESGFTSAAAGQLESYEKDTWELTVTHEVGSAEFAVSYVDSGEGDCTLTGGTACSTNGLDANMINLGVLYSFDRRLGVYALYSMLDNGESANHANVDVPVAPGADTKAAAVGVLLRF